MVTVVVKVTRACKENRDKLAMLVLRVNLDLRVNKGHLVHLVLRAQGVRMASKELKANVVKTENRVLPVQLVQLVHKVDKVL